MPIPEFAEALWTQVCRGPVDIADFDKSLDLKYLTEQGLVEMVNHPSKPLPSKQLVLTLKGQVLSNISIMAISNKDLLFWMHNIGVQFPLSMLKELIDAGHVGYVRSNGLYYKTI